MKRIKSQARVTQNLFIAFVVKVQKKYTKRFRTKDFLSGLDRQMNVLLCFVPLIKSIFKSILWAKAIIIIQLSDFFPISFFSISSFHLYIEN